MRPGGLCFGLQTRSPGWTRRRRRTATAGPRPASAGEGERAPDTGQGPSPVNVILTENWQLLTRREDLPFSPSPVFTKRTTSFKNHHCTPSDPSHKTPEEGCSVEDAMSVGMSPLTRHTAHGAGPRQRGHGPHKNVFPINLYTPHPTIRISFFQTDLQFS